MPRPSSSRFNSRRRTEDTEKASLDIVKTQLSAGQVNQLAVLNAQPTYLTAAVVRVQTDANRLSDTALFMALGRGWPAGCSGPDWRVCAANDAPDHSIAPRTSTALSHSLLDRRRRQARDETGRDGRLAFQAPQLTVARLRRSVVSGRRVSRS